MNHLQQTAIQAETKNIQNEKNVGRLNCWEFMQCGREKGGPNVDELGVCPASEETHLDKVNNGKNGGRSCWAISGTLCNGNAQGTFAQKILNCHQCIFFKTVLSEEGAEWVSTNLILSKLKDAEIQIIENLMEIEKSLGIDQTQRY